MRVFYWQFINKISIPIIIQDASFSVQLGSLNKAQHR